MDHFENIVRLVLQNEGYWIIPSFKVNLTKEEKRKTGKHTIPRPEIDLIAYKPKSKEILAIEVKSFFDSTGVNPAELEERHEIAEGRYKLFTCQKYREIVFGRLQLDLVEQGFLESTLSVRLGLVVGKIKKGCNTRLRDLATENNWFYLSANDIKYRVKQLSQSGYENEAVYVAAKILLRDT